MPQADGTFQKVVLECDFYRSRGYNFDITSTTQYDQKYTVGKTIPDNISQIVDNIFNEYLRRPGYREPLFSSYCDGTTVTCSGMSQWGTVDLANSGYSPMGILKYYYGDNIEVAETDKVSGILTSYPGYTLSQGTSNASVAQMQTFLNRIATDFPAIPKVTPNGNYNAATAAAVREFQRIENLPQTGVIDKATWNRISFRYVAVTNLDELDSEGQRIGIGTSPPTSVIREGARGGDVVQLQFLLNAIGAYYDSIPSLIEDGSFGVTTTNSVKAFQQQFGLTPDGIVGPGTWSKLYDVYKSLDIGNGTEEDVPVYPGVPLTVGSRGGNVELIQSFLNALSDTYPSIPKVMRDGIFGPASQAQVSEFQRLFGLSADGVVGPATWNAIMNVYFYGGASILPPPPPPSSAPSFPGYYIQQGQSGENVRVLQTYINMLADQYSSIPHVTADGIFGPGTKTAVMAAQSFFGLIPDGIVGPDTWNAIVKGESTSPAPAPAFPGYLIQQGQSGENVRVLQTYINKLANRYPSIPHVTADGIFGPGTRAAVVAAQRVLGLTADGIVGPSTWNAIVSNDTLYSSGGAMPAMLSQTSYSCPGCGTAAPAFNTYSSKRRFY